MIQLPFTRDKALKAAIDLRAGKKVMVKTTCDGYWSFIFSAQGSVTDPLLGQLPELPRNIFSAKVFGSTTEEDWRTLGAMAAAIGAPRESFPRTIETNPDAVHYYFWESQ